MTDFIEIIKQDDKIKNNILQVVDKYNKQSYETRSILGQKALIQSSIFKEAINIMGDTINDMDVEMEENDNKINFLENKIGITDDKVVEEMIKYDLYKIANKEKNDRIMNRLNKTLNNHKYITNQQ